jgi:hypothetical protein
MTAIVVSAAAALRVATIMLGREASTADAAAFGPPSDLAAMIKLGVTLPAIAPLPARQQVIRSYNAILGRYDAVDPCNIDHFMKLLALGDYAVGAAAANQNSLVDLFCEIQNSGYRDDPCGAPATKDAPMAVARDAAGHPLLFAVGANRHCLLFRLQDGVWTQTDLSAQLPAPRHCHVQALDVQQDKSGAITIAIAVCARRGDSASTLYLARGLSNALDATGWAAAFHGMQARAGAPSGAEIDNLAITAAGSSNPMLLIGAAVKGVMNSYYFELASDPGPWTMLRIPEDADHVIAYAIGRYRYPGVWTLYRVGTGISMIFSSFPDQFGKTINLGYTGLPAHCGSFLLGTAPDIPDLYAAGDGVVAYRASHANPDVIVPPAAVTGAALVWATKTATAEHVAYLGADHTLMVVTKAGGTWGKPYPVAEGMDKAILLGAPTDAGLDVVGLTPGGRLEWVQWQDGRPATPQEITQHAVWEEIPLAAAELNTAITAAAPVAYLATDEQYFPSTVQFYLRKVGLWNEIQEKWELAAGTLLDPATNDLIPAAVAVRPRSALSDPKHDSDYTLKIPDADYPALLPGHPQDSPFYVHAKFNPAENATDLIFWGFYPYNGAGLLKLDTPGLNRRVDLQPLGVHEGDWEHFLLRVDNDSLLPVKTYLSQHNSGSWTDVSVLERDPATQRLTFYISRHGHACYAGQGDNLLQEQKAGLYDIGLINHCDRGQRINVWEPGRTSLVSAPWLGAAAPAEPVWLQLPWRWGRYFDFSTAQVQQTVDSVLGNAVPGFITSAVAAELIKSGVLGGEGNSAGPQAIKLKPNWFGSEDD